MKVPIDTVDYGELIKKVEEFVESIAESDDVTGTILRVTDRIISAFRDQLGIRGGRLYRRRDGGYVLEATLGDATGGPVGLELPTSYPAIELVLALRVVYMDGDDPRLDPTVERAVGAREFAAIEVGDRDYLLAFDLQGSADRERVLYSLGILRHAINQKIREERMEEVFQQARRIQGSIVPRRVPTYGEFDVAGHTRPMESVGGDHYDYIPITDKILGLAIADVSGHGLPAALQVRDIYTGLRMGGARDFKIVRTVELLNRIIHQSTLTSRFVSMVYGELELDGLFIYVNAGHPPPFHIDRRGETRWLTEGGPVLGPIPDSTYARGFVRLQPGDTLLFYTDGIVEADGGDSGDEPEEFGVERLLAAARRLRGRPAAEVVEALFSEVDEFTGGRPAEDDRTLLVVRHPE